MSAALRTRSVRVRVLPGVQTRDKPLVLRRSVCGPVQSARWQRTSRSMPRILPGQTAYRPPVRVATVSTSTPTTRPTSPTTRLRPGRTPTPTTPSGKRGSTTSSRAHASTVGVDSPRARWTSIMSGGRRSTTSHGCGFVAVPRLRSWLRLPSVSWCVPTATEFARTVDLEHEGPVVGHQPRKLGARKGGGSTPPCSAMANKRPCASSCRDPENRSDKACCCGGHSQRARKPRKRWSRIKLESKPPMAVGPVASG